MIISGNPGIGKSTFAIFELYLSLRSGKFKAIVYENPNWDISCVFKQDSVEGATVKHAGATVKQKQDPVEGATGEPVEGATGEPVEGATGEPVEGATVNQDSVECPHYAIECEDYAVEDALDDCQTLYLFDCAPGKYPKNRLAKTIVFSSLKYDNYKL